jgi:hypothetical protein
LLTCNEEHKIMKKNPFLYLNNFVLLFALIVFVTVKDCAAKTISLVTYYPEPVGSFDRLRLFPLPEITTTPCNIGTVYISTTDNGKLSFCADDDTNSDQGFWTTIGEVWSKNGNNLSLDSGNLNSFLGIGTKTPEFKLSLDNDGGILARGQFNGGSSLTDTGVGVRFLWYPRKAASFAGAITTDTFNLGPVFSDATYPATARGVLLWGDDLIGNHSVVKGGLNNIAPGLLAYVGGGEGNMAGLAIVRTAIMPTHNGSAMTVGGGRNNSAMWRFNDTAHQGQDGAIVLGGFNNKADSRAASVLGGANNSCEIRDISNNITAISIYQNIGGGLNNTSLGNLVGGQNNTTINTSSTVIGGFQNSANLSIIIAGSENTASSESVNALGSIILGGRSNNAFTGSLIAGGQLNTNNQKTNNTFTNSFSAVILGGQNNRISGDNNSLNPQSHRAVIMGGLNNTIEQSAENSVILGGRDNFISKSNSVAGGRNIRITGTNTFAWGYEGNVATPLTITADNAFVIASGHVGINDIDPTEQLTVNGNVRIDNGQLLLQNAPAIAGGSPLRFNANNAIARDVAEIFEATEDIEDGELVMILNQEQKIAIARHPYDKKVIGISSMAPAIILQGQKLQLSNGNYQFKKGQQVPLALKGRVLCKVTNENGAIVPGDLLTLSSIAGHAMRLGDKNLTRASIVAKALEPFNPTDSSKTPTPATGKILVFVTLQ